MKSTDNTLLVDRLTSPQKGITRAIKLFDSVNVHVTVYLRYHATQSLARTALGEVVGTIGNHILHTLGPTYGTGELGNEVGLNLDRVGMRLAVNILIDGADRSLHLNLLDGSLQLVFGGLHEW